MSSQPCTLWRSIRNKNNYFINVLHVIFITLNIHQCLFLSLLTLLPRFIILYIHHSLHLLHSFSIPGLTTQLGPGKRESNHKLDPKLERTEAWLSKCRNWTTESDFSTASFQMSIRLCHEKHPHRWLTLGCSNYKRFSYNLENRQQ